MVNFIKIELLKESENNPRFIKEDKFNKLVKSIEEFPDMLEKRPLIASSNSDGTYTILGGNMRLKALKQLKYKEVPVITADNWTEEQKKEFLIKDNVGFGEWDWDVLANEWDSELLNEWGLNTFNLDKEYFDFDETKEEEEEEYNPKASDDDYSTFELVMLHENKLKLLEVLNKIKQEYLFEKLEEALMELIRKY